MSTQDDSREKPEYVRRDDDRALDHLLESAGWPEAKPEQLSRLQARWHKLWRPRRLVPWRAAAAILAAAGLVWWAVSRNANIAPDNGRAEAMPEGGPQVSSDVTDDRQTVPKPASAPINNVPTDTKSANAPLATQPPKETAGIGPRDPSPLEMLVYISARRGRGNDKRVRSPRAPVSPRSASNHKREEERHERLEHALAALGDDADSPPLAGEDVKAAELTKTLSPDAGWFEVRLKRLLDEVDNPQRAAAIRLWTQLAGSRALPKLRELYRDEATRDVALAELLRWESPGGLAWLIESADDDDVRYVVLAELFRRGDERSVGRFLNFVLEDETAALACESLDEVEVPPIETLFGFLRSPRRPQRLAAAVVLGRIGDSSVVERLTTMVQANDSPQNALAALVSSSHPEAADFVRWASGDLYLAATVRAAGHHLKSLPADLWRFSP